MDSPRRGPESCIIRQIQQSLEQIYRIHLHSDIENYLIDTRTLGILAGHFRISRQPCQVLVLQGDQSPEIAVHVDEGILERLETANPMESFSTGTMADFCALVEEVSHFVYLVWNIHNERSIRRLEIELQGEVDKYVLCALLLLGQDQSQIIRDLVDRLFHRFRLDDHLEPVEKERYLRANSLALRYCTFLERRFLRDLSPSGLFEEIRLFYRLPQEEKLQRIRSLPVQ